MENLLGKTLEKVKLEANLVGRIVFVTTFFGVFLFVGVFFFLVF